MQSFETCNNSLFESRWWLSLVGKDGEWDIIESKKNGKIISALPWYKIKNRLGFNIITHPPLTPLMGPWLRDLVSLGKGSKMVTQLAKQKSTLSELFQMLPPHDAFSQCFHPSQNCLLPLRLMGYQQSIYYTYQINNISSLDDVWNGFAQKIRTDIRKSEKNSIISCDYSPDVLLDLVKKTYARQSIKVPYSLSLLKRVIIQSLESNRGLFLVAAGKSGSVYASTFIVYDHRCAYYLVSGADPAFTSTGSMSHLLWSAIQILSTKTRAFDFEGSIIPRIETYVRGFGGIPIQYSHVSRTPNKYLRLFKAISSAL